MIKEIRTVKDGVMQITCSDERWYSKQVINAKTGLPEIEFVPSCTWILNSYPKGEFFQKWLMTNGENSETIKKDAGARGSRIHHACELIDMGQEITFDTLFQNEGSIDSPLTADEYSAVISFRDWLDSAKPQLLACEVTVFGKGYAGTVDRIYRMPNKDIVLLDLKSSQAGTVYPAWACQVSAYAHAEIGIASIGVTPQEWSKVKLAILQVGYRKSKTGYKYTEVEDEFDLFQAVYKIWQRDNSNAKPTQRDLPLAISAVCRTKKEA
jgi:hypothetical protein